jgi:septal ring-binding cell division protein DamX
VLTTADARAIERFLEQAVQEVKLEDVYIYSVKVDGRQYYGVTYGNYPSLEETITAMGDLPLSFKSRGPFHRSIPVMRRQNQE